MGSSQATKHVGRVIIAASLLGISGPVSADDASIVCHGDRRVCDTVVAGERDLTSMMVSGDVGIVFRLFADDAVWSLGNGTRWTKAEAIAALRKAPKKAHSRLLKAEVRQFGRVAIVLWSETWRNSVAGPEEQSLGTDTWMLRAGQWQIIASQEAPGPTLRGR